MTVRHSFRREVSLRTQEAWHGYGFILIWVVGFALFTLLPLIQTFRYSLNQVTVTATSINLNFVAWGNYTRALFTDPNFVGLPGPLLREFPRFLQHSRQRQNRRRRP